VNGSLVDSSTGREIAARIVRAGGPIGRTVGLLGRGSLTADDGMWFDGTASIHTFGMRASIDVVFLGRDGRIVAVFERLAPWRMAAARGASDAVELAAGTCSRTGLRVGMTVEVRWRSST